MASTLVTGGCGYIGSELIRKLPEKFENIRIIDNMMRERYVSLWELPNSAKYEFVEGDIRNEKDVRKSMEDVEVLIDLAGITNAPLSFKRRDLTMDVNVGGVKNLIKAALDSNIKQYIYSSSASVYGPTGGEVDESYDCKPVSPYGESKLLAEKELLKAKEENGLRVTILRFGTVYGWSVGMRFDTVIDRWVYLACIGRSIEVWEVNKGESRPYVHVDDVCRSVLFVTNPAKLGLFNVVSKNIILGDVVKAVQKNIPNCTVIETDRENLNQLSYKLDNSKLVNLGFKYEYDLDRGIKTIVDKFKGLNH